MRTKLQPGETVALIVRKHWVVLLKPALFLMAVFLFIPVRHIKKEGYQPIGKRWHPQTVKRVLEYERRKAA